MQQRKMLLKLNGTGCCLLHSLFYIFVLYSNPRNAEEKKGTQRMYVLLYIYKNRNHFLPGNKMNEHKKSKRKYIYVQCSYKTRIGMVGWLLWVVPSRWIILTFCVYDLFPHCFVYTSVYSPDNNFLSMRCIPLTCGAHKNSCIYPFEYSST